jgi:hypothetical protein
MKLAICFMLLVASTCQAQQVVYYPLSPPAIINRSPIGIDFPYVKVQPRVNTYYVPVERVFIPGQIQLNPFYQK